MLLRLFYITILLYLPALAVVTAASAPAVTRLQYEVYQDGKRVGNIVASCSTQGETASYEVETRMDVKVVFTQRVRYNSTAVYRRGQLQNSSAVSYLNDKVYQSCHTTLNNGRYDIRREKGNTTLRRNVTYSGVLLYFREPGETSVVFSEMTGQDNSMRRNADGSYTLTDSKSKKQNRYWYKGGILERAMLNSIVDIEVRRVH